MLTQSILPLGIGILLGFLSGLGVGGGSLLILYLTLILDTPAQEAKAMNLMFFIPSALIASLFRMKQGSLQAKYILPALAAAVGGCILFSFISTGLDTQFLRKPFGILLVITGLRELFYRERKAR